VAAKISGQEGAGVIALLIAADFLQSLLMFTA
jgi:hypothetical protein